MKSKQNRIRDFNPHLGPIDETMETYMPMVTKLVHKEFSHLLPYLRLDFNDLQSEGYLGLLRAFGNFEPGDRQAQFATYATYVVRGQIKNYIVRQGQLFNASHKIHTIALGIQREGWYLADPAEIAAKMNKPVKSVKTALHYLQLQVCCLDENRI